MIQVSLVGYFVGGAFQNLAYWDLPYYELILLVLIRDLIRRQFAVEAQGTRAGHSGQSGPETPQTTRASTHSRGEPVRGAGVRRR